jgi:prevent-host-death family protein
LVVRFGGLMAERFVGVEQARGQLGRLVEEVAGGAHPIALTKRGQPLAVLVSRDEWQALRELVRAEARDELRRRLRQLRRRVTSAGLDPTTVDEAIEAARKVS